MTASSRLSVRNCRLRRERLAPSAARSADSALRRLARGEQLAVVLDAADGAPAFDVVDRAFRLPAQHLHVDQRRGIQAALGMRSKEFLESEVRRTGLRKIDLRHARTLPQFLRVAYTSIRRTRCQEARSKRCAAHRARRPILSHKCRAAR